MFAAQHQGLRAESRDGKGEDREGWAGTLEPGRARDAGGGGYPGGEEAERTDLADFGGPRRRRTLVTSPSFRPRATSDLQLEPLQLTSV